MRLEGAGLGGTGGWAGGRNGQMRGMERQDSWALDLWGFLRWACLLGKLVESPGMKPRV